MMIRHRQIEAFRAIMRHGTAVGAARHLKISQPAVSRLISDLEEGVGFPLFSRASGRLHPTQNGRRFYRVVEDTFAGIEKLELTAEMIRLNTENEFVVACQPIASTSLLPAILTDFAKSGFRVPIRIESIRTPEAISQIQNRNALLAICYEFTPTPDIVLEPFIRVPALCAMPASHRLSSREVIQPQDLRGEHMIGSLSHALGELDRNLLRAANYGIPQYAYLTDTIHTRFALVSAGLGLSIVDAYSANLWSHQGVAVRPFSSELSFDYVLAYLSADRNSLLITEFRKSANRIAKQFLSNLTP
ncbi:LysR family transcriptional regulator [Burkholderia stagnalis]|uniref:LysR family transcriptional regulator n=1 Tax=Burkholderia stagnalis TaxID=1503054 RepID=UPI0009BCEDB7|nr:LysR substrate-binding domain-containing protein [Burkholderia stagnalis]MDY7804168.1 LysR substrate-binding domain-containing protein [Burkholderia stagnalis]